ncbi:MAG TPA: TetR/AcrR family transcriptional regulator [Ilumatobacteraceae bacterium]
MNAAKIRTVAIEVFATHGYHGASLRQIAKASGLTLGTLYHYYPSKQDLLAELMRDALAPLISSGHRVRAEFPGDPEHQLFEAVRRFVTTTLEDPQLAIIADVELRSLTGDNAAQAIAMRDEYEGIIRSIVADGVASGVFAAGDVKMVSFAVLAISNQPAYWYDPGGAMSRDEVAVEQAQLAVRLVLAP